MKFEALGCEWSITLRANTATAKTSIDSPARSSVDDLKDSSRITETALSTVLMQAQKHITDFVQEYTATFSRFDTHSLVSKIAHETCDTKNKHATYQFPQYAHDLFVLYKSIYILTKGMITPCLGQTLSDIGYDQAYSLSPKASISSACDFNTIECKVSKNKSVLVQIPHNQCVHFDFGAAGKGYLAELIASILCKHEYRDFFINASGDILHTSPTQTPITVGLEHPFKQNTIIGTAKLNNASIAGSASNRRAWTGYHHILNPHTKQSPKNILATWVVARKASHADIIATALFLVEPIVLQSEFDFEYCILYTNQSIVCSNQSIFTLFTS